MPCTHAVKLCRRPAESIASVHQCFLDGLLHTKPVRAVLSSRAHRCLVLQASQAHSILDLNFPEGQPAYHLRM